MVKNSSALEIDIVQELTKNCISRESNDMICPPADFSAPVEPVAVLTHNPELQIFNEKCDCALVSIPAKRSEKPMRNLLTAAGQGCEMRISLRAGGSLVSVKALFTMVKSRARFDGFTIP